MITSPFFTKPTKTSAVMMKVLVALIPGIAAYVSAFGIGILVQIILATMTAVIAETIVLKLRRLPVAPFLNDLSAVVTAWLLALSIPPLAPWWIVVVGTLIAIVIAKHLYGGLGNNPFNPAMVGFAALIISFPAVMSQWPAPVVLPLPNLSDADQLTRIFSGLTGPAWDAVASATPLDVLKTQLHNHVAITDVLQQPIFGLFGGIGSEWIAFGFLLGGIYLLSKRIIPWHVPVAYLGGLGLTAAAFYWGGVEGAATPWFHLFSGAAMLGAFFILTDPVTGPTTPRGRLIFAALAGLLTYLIRVYGAFPDGVAFAVLIMNIAAPLIDRYTQPPVFGRKGRGGKA